MIQIKLNASKKPSVCKVFMVHKNISIVVVVVVNSVKELLCWQVLGVFFVCNFIFYYFRTLTAIYRIENFEEKMSL